MRTTRRRLASVISAASITIGGSAAAATSTWSANGDGTWSNGANWSSGSAPAPGDDLVFPDGPLGLHATNDLPSGTTIRSITVGGAGYILDGNAVALAGDLTITAPGAGPTIAFPIALAGSVTIANGGAGTSVTTFSAPEGIDLGPYVLTLSGSGKMIFSGTLSGAGSLVHGAGLCEVVLAKDNTYTGTTTINAGSMTLRTSNGLGSSSAGTVVQGTGMLRIASPGSVSVAEPLVLATGASTSFASIIGDVFWSGPISLGADAHLYTNTPMTIAGTISGPHAVMFSAGDGLTLTGTNTYGGGTVIASGNLIVAGPTSLPAGPVKTWLQASLTVGPGTYANALTLQGSTFPYGGLRTVGHTQWSGPIEMMSADSAIENAGTLFLTGGVSGSGGFTKRGTGDLWISSNGTYTGGTQVVSGGLVCAVAGCLPDGSYVDVNGQLHLAGGVAETIGSLVSSNGSGLVVVGPDSTLTTAGHWNSQYGGTITGPGNMVFAGLSGTKYLTGVSSHTGTTTIQSESVNVYGSVQSPIAVASGALLGLGSDAHVGQLASTGGTIATVFSWTASSTSSGLVLDAASTFEPHLEGATAAEQGRLIVNGSVSLGGASLKIVLGFAPAVGDAFVIIDNDGVEPIAGTFGGLAEGAAFNVGSTGVKVSYAGGDGNDVTLTIVPKVIESGPDDAGTESNDADSSLPWDSGTETPDAARPSGRPTPDVEAADATTSAGVGAQPSAAAEGGCRIGGPKGSARMTAWTVLGALAVARWKRRRR